MINFIEVLLLISGVAFANEAELLANLEQKINFSMEEKVQLLIEKQEIEKQIAELQSKIKERKQTLIIRLKALNQIKRFQWGELLINNNLNNLNRNLKILKNLNQFDYEIFKEYNLALKLLALSRKNLAETELQIQNNIKLYEKQLEEFKKLEALHVNWLANNKSDSFLLNKGKLSRPLEGRVALEFGNLKDQLGQYYLLNRGELYKTTKNSLVKSVGLGVVIFRDELNRWRETVIVQHSDNYYSVYAGVSDVLKNVGDTVTAGEVLGNTSSQEFYFELRHLGYPINPKKWFGE